MKNANQDAEHEHMSLNMVIVCLPDGRPMARLWVNCLKAEEWL
jgi:hypothetical protein